MKFDGAHLRGADQRGERVDRDQRRMARIESLVLRDVRNRQLLAVLLEEQLTADILGRAHQRDGSLAQMRQHPFGD